VRKAVLGIFGLSLLALPCLASAQAAAPSSAPESPAALVERLQGHLQRRDLDAYAGAFAPDLRPAERNRIGAFFDDLNITAAVLRIAGVQPDPGGGQRVSVQAFFENDEMAIIESWLLALARGEGGAWSISRFDITGAMTRLYKVRIPSDRAVRARRVEVRHADVRFTFDDAAVFYDNLPNIETGLVVIGRGRVEFTPSDANERHQLDLLYKRDRVEDEIDSLFVRCSTGFFDSNVVIEPAAAGRPVSPVERDQAEAVFARNHPRYFTIESSVDGGLLSFLPQGDESVLTFNARRRGEMSYVYSPFTGDEVSLYDHGNKRTICLYSPRGPESSPPLKRMALALAEKFDISFYALDLGLTPSSSRLSAKAHIEFVPKVAGLDDLKLRFNTDLEILKITDAQNRGLFYTVDKSRQMLYIYFLSPEPEGEPTSIDVYYRGRLQPAAPTTDVIGQAHFDDKIRFRPRYETAFYTHAGFWYPGPTDEDYFTARLTLTVPPEYQCIANGELVGRTQREDLGDVAAVEHAGNAVYTFVSRSPVKYLSFIVGKFEQKKERPGTVPVSSYVSSGVNGSRSDLVDRAADILDFYAAAFGAYPYEKLGIVFRLWPVFGGHCPASFVVINEVPWAGLDGFPVPADTAVDLTAYDEYFLAHEIAHQWWGQGVSFDSYKDQWLSEGLAQFAAASYLRRKHGEGAFASILRKFSRWTAKKSFRGPITMGSRLSYFDFDAYQAIVYDKAALALFMLQDLLGRDVFEAGLRSFFERHKFRAARTGEFITAMEAASGRDLKAFFQGWFDAWELPDVRTSWTETSVPEGVRIDLRVTQVKGRFVFPLWVEWSRQGQTGRMLVVVDEASETASLTLPGPPDRIRVNPDKAVPGKFD